MTREEFEEAKIKMFAGIKWANTDPEVIGKVVEEINGLHRIKDLEKYKDEYIKNSEHNKKIAVRYMEELSINYAKDAMVDYAVCKVMIDLIDFALDENC